MTPEELETLVLDSKDGNDIRLAFKDMDAKEKAAKIADIERKLAELGK